MDQRTRGLGGRGGRIILLGDGHEPVMDTDEHEIMDHEDEEEDFESNAVSSSGSTSGGDSRSQREGTPGPEPAREGSPISATKVSTSPTATSPSSTGEEAKSTIIQAADEPSKSEAE